MARPGVALHDITLYAQTGQGMEWDMLSNDRIAYNEVWNDIVYDMIWNKECYDILWYGAMRWDMIWSYYGMTTIQYDLIYDMIWNEMIWQDMMSCHII